MENNIKIIDKIIGDNTYQFRYESATRQIEVLIKRSKKKNWYSDKRIEYWEPFQIGDIKLYMEIVKFQFVNTNKDMIMEATGNQSLLELIDRIEKLNPGL